MFRRTVAPICLFFLLFPAPAAILADVIVTKDGKVEGFPAPDVNGVPINEHNVAGFLEESTGYIEREGYDGTEIKKREKDAKGRVIPESQIKQRLYSSAPEALQDGEDNMQVGAYAQAIAAFQTVLQDKEAREVFKDRASYNIGRCYFALGNVRNTIDHWGKWPAKNSRYTPEIYDYLAQILTSQRQYDKAREYYGKIGALPEIPESWKMRARLGEVKVDVAERNYDKAEQAAKQVVGQASGAGLADERAMAMALQAQAILVSDKSARYPEAQAILEKAAAIPECSDAQVRGLVFSTLGDALYKQGKPEEARFPYMRVVCLYPETGYVAGALLNAGNCLLDMSTRLLDKDQAKSDEYLESAMKLLAECAARHKGTEFAREAGKRYMEYKPRFDRLRGGADASTSGAAPER